MKHNSIWETNISFEKSKKSIKDFKTDILIIGGGIAGLSTAYFLKDSNKKITIIDKSYVGMGITSKTTAKINYLQGIIYQQLESSFSLHVSKQYFNSQKDAINLINQVIETENISCDLKQCNSYIFTLEEKGIPKIKKEKELLTRFGANCFDIKHSHIKSGIGVSDTYTFHPLKYMSGLKESIKDKVSIYENVMALEIRPRNDEFVVITNKNTITASHVIVTCHYPFFLLPSLVPIKTYIKREYVNASKYEVKEDYTAISIDSTLHSIRFYKDYIIYGSNQHRLTNKIDYQKNYEQSKKDFQNLFHTEPEYTWMNQDVMSNDHLPIIGIPDTRHHNLLIATAFNAWGMTNGTLAGKILSDLVLKKKNKYTSLFDPKRKNPTLILKSLLGAMHYAKVYIQTLRFKKKPHVYTMRINGQKAGIYVDENNKKHIVSLTCPHMKCHLVFNNEEHTWDCPCHGSRFDIDGNVLEGPSNYSIKITKDN